MAQPPITASNHMSQSTSARGASGLADASEKEQDDAVHTTIPHRPDLLLISAERTTLGALMRPRAA